MKIDKRFSFYTEQAHVFAEFLLKRFQKLAFLVVYMETIGFQITPPWKALSRSCVFIHIFSVFMVS